MSQSGSFLAYVTQAERAQQFNWINAVGLLFFCCCCFVQGKSYQMSLSRESKPLDVSWEFSDRHNFQSTFWFRTSKLFRTFPDIRGNQFGRLRYSRDFWGFGAIRKSKMAAPSPQNGCMAAISNADGPGDEVVPRDHPLLVVHVCC